MVNIASIVLSHHEKYDGSGYPFKLVGTDIPVASRIISIVDSYDAMINDRPYRAKRSKEYAIGELIAGSGTQFDPKLVKLFVSQMEGKI